MQASLGVAHAIDAFGNQKLVGPMARCVAGHDLGDGACGAIALQIRLPSTSVASARAANVPLRTRASRYMLGLCVPAYKKRSMGSLGKNYASLIRTRSRACLVAACSCAATAFAQWAPHCPWKSKRLANSTAPARAWPSGSADGRRAERVRFRARRRRDRESDGSATCAHQNLHRRTDEPHPPACPR